MKFALTWICGAALLSYIVTGGPIHYARLVQNITEEHRRPICGKKWLVGGYLALLIPLVLVGAFVWLIVTG